MITVRKRKDTMIPYELEGYRRLYAASLDINLEIV